MNRRTSRMVVSVLCLLLLLGAPLPAQQPSPAKDKNDPIERIKDEGMNRSQVMQTLSYLTDVIGPRLTASPNLKRANEWTRDKLTEWGLQNAHLEPWGPFGRGWSLKHFAAEIVEPQAIPLIAFPKAWSPGVNVTGAEIVYVDAKDEGELQKFKGTLKDKVVMISKPREIKARFEAPGKRLEEKDLLRLADAPDPNSRQRGPSPFEDPQLKDFINQAIFGAKRLKFCAEEGAALIVESSRSGDGGTIFLESAVVPQALDTSSMMATVRSLFLGKVNPYDKDAPKIPAQITVASEHYNRIVRMIQAGEKVRISVGLDVEFHDQDLMAYNTIAEIPGTDKKDELVMVGAHMDSWHSGTGATDNGAGCGVAMEAVRILKALNLQPRRTIRIGLWSGEEQGIFGSRAYVAQHFGKPEESEDASFMRMVMGGGAPPKITRGPEYDKLSGYFNLDNGTGKIRGVYLQGNEAVRPIFREWLAPFREAGAATLSISNTGGTDHLSFDAIGLPGFQFIQDEVEYGSRTHHSNQDVFDRIQADDMKQAATIMAAFLYQTAMRDEKLPRKPVK
ncbi:MAG TPA: M20/M25/M40 family metallo-hydrolase [Blastocatellia bacterium]|nr:M20/M25/M40 family metallo-hydrolase [Blastocatellia bacterium]